MAAIASASSSPRVASTSNLCVAWLLFLLCRWPHHTIPHCAMLRVQSVEAASMRELTAACCRALLQRSPPGRRSAEDVDALVALMGPLEVGGRDGGGGTAGT